MGVSVSYVGVSVSYVCVCIMWVCLYHIWVWLYYTWLCPYHTWCVSTFGCAHIRHATRCTHSMPALHVCHIRYFMLKSQAYVCTHSTYMHTCNIAGTYVYDRACRLTSGISPNLVHSRESNCRTSSSSFVHRYILRSIETSTSDYWRGSKWPSDRRRKQSSSRPIYQPKSQTSRFLGDVSTML